MGQVEGLPEGAGRDAMMQDLDALRLGMFATRDQEHVSLLNRQNQPATRAAAAMQEALSPNALFDHLVGTGEERGRDVEIEGSGGPQVQGQLKFGWQFNGEISGLFTLQNAINHARCARIKMSVVRSVRHKATVLHELLRSVHRGKLVLRREIDN
jgi:hypothetical protein